MNVRTILLTIGFLPLGLLGAAERVKDYREARAMAEATEYDIAVFLYGSDWSRAGRELKENVWDSETLSSAVGDEVILLAVDHPEGIERNRRKKRISELLESFAPSQARMGEVTCANGTVPVKQADRSVLATAANPVTEVYAFDLRVPDGGADIVVVEFLPDDSLPQRGPGRAKQLRCPLMVPGRITCTTRRRGRFWQQMGM